MKSTKTGTVALIVGQETGKPQVVATLSDDFEITAFEEALRSGEKDPLEQVQALRRRQAKEDEDFGNYVEELLSHPFVRPEIQEHGLQWLESKMRIERFKRTELDAARIIADYALKVYEADRNSKDFILAGPVTRVRIRVFELPQGSGFSKAA